MNYNAYILKSFQRTRNLMLWHDTSTVSTHSHLLMLVKCLYDAALFFTDDEYKQQYGKKMCVQTAVEKPVIYILARCPPTDERIKFTQTRVDDLKVFQHKLQTKKGNVTDVMRFSMETSLHVALKQDTKKGETISVGIVAYLQRNLTT